MARMNHHKGIQTGYGCYYDEPCKDGSPIITKAYFECPDLIETLETAARLLRTQRQVTVMSNGLYNVRTYWSVKELIYDYPEMTKFIQTAAMAS